MRRKALRFSVLQGRAISMDYQSTADYFHLDAALKILWTQFLQITKEMDTFVPRPLTDYADEHKSKLEHFQTLNPTHSTESIEKVVSDSISLKAQEKIQFVDQFSERFMGQYVMAVLISHALCEGVINAILAIGLAQAKSPELFSIFEKVDVKEKWRTGPKMLRASYELKPGIALFETLSYLTKRRNALVHNKIHLRVGGKKVLEGSKFERTSFQENMHWMRRFFSVPYDLSDHASIQLSGLGLMVLEGSSPIDRFQGHKMPVVGSFG
jgi:hypothetical protein